MKVYSVQTPVLYDRLFFLLFFNRKTLIFCHRVVSEALEHTSGSHTHMHARAHTHAQYTQAAKAEFSPTDYCYQSGYLPLCTYSYSNKHQQHSDPDTFSHTYPFTNTLGEQCTSVGSPMAKGCKALTNFSTRKKKKKKKDSAHRTG